MQRRARLRWSAGAALLAALGVLAVPASSAAHTGQPVRRIPIPTVSIAGLPSPRLDQDTTQTMRAVGASRLAAVTVLWGDGSSTRGTSPCTRAQAVRAPDQCTVKARRSYTRMGVYTITVLSGERVVARTRIVVRAAARPWRPPSGWVQPAGWSMNGTSAAYAPCSTVLWFYDSRQEPDDARRMHDEVAAGLAKLSQETGLVYKETGDSGAARLWIGWDALTGDHADAAALGGRQNGRGVITINTENWWTSDEWAGFGKVVQPDGRSAVGRGWLIVHETMHTLGLGHVNDPAAIMNPVAGATDFSAGDLDGLRTMYRNNPCPV